MSHPDTPNTTFHVILIDNYTVHIKDLLLKFHSSFNFLCWKKKIQECLILSLKVGYYPFWFLVITVIEYLDNVLGKNTEMFKNSLFPEEAHRSLRLVLKKKD